MIDKSSLTIPHFRLFFTIGRGATASAADSTEELTATADAAMAVFFKNSLLCIQVSGECSDTWFCHLYYRWFHIKAVGVWSQLFSRVQCILPGNTLTSVTGHSTHDGDQCAVRHEFAVVDQLTATDRSKQFI